VTVAGRSPPVPGYDPHDIEPPDLALPPADAKRTRPERAAHATPAPKTDGCRSGCAKEHATCKAACKSEPTDASDYEAWQGCLAKCLAAESGCRQRCP
jgi:hypothetical protein